MAPSIVHLPNGTTLSVNPSFGGLSFKANELSVNHNAFPPGWSIILHTEDDEDDLPAHPEHGLADADATPKAETSPLYRRRIHRFRQPSLRNDHLFISSISNPSSNDFRPANSPTRQIAMMLWATLWWYFHQPAPSPHMTTPASEGTPDLGKPKGDWRVYINREGILQGKHLLPKLERMGLIASEDSAVGVDPEDGVSAVSEGYSKMFVSSRSFWQLDARIYLFTLTPLTANSPFPLISPASSRPSSPNRNSYQRSTDELTTSGASTPAGTSSLSALSITRAHTPPNPFSSTSHLPTYYPPPPLQYTFSSGIRHPIRAKPPRQGEVFYTRYIPSLEQYLSFRVASLSKFPVFHRAPTSTHHHPSHQLADLHAAHKSSSSSSSNDGTTAMTDVELLHKWMNDPRVAASWGETGPLAHQEQFLRNGLTSRHSMPVIGCFDGKPFGYFEIYWVKEDRLALYLGGACDDWDRGVHVLVGEQEFRGPHRVRVWLSALAHYCWLADSRTQVVMLEPRVDNAKLRKYCEEVGFFKEKEIRFPHKQSNLMKIRREAWDAPEL